MAAIIVFLFLIIILILIEFLKNQKLNQKFIEKDPNPDLYEFGSENYWKSLEQELKILERYKRSFTSRQKKYIEYIGFDNYPVKDLGPYKEIKEYFKQCDIEGNGNYWKGLVNKRNGLRYQLRFNFKMYKYRNI